jgi:hypothetical protein
MRAASLPVGKRHGSDMEDLPAGRMGRGNSAESTQIRREFTQAGLVPASPP